MNKRAGDSRSDYFADEDEDLLAVQTRQISIENIQKTVADYYKIKVAEMYSKKRSRVVARPRQMAMAISKELTPLSLPDIGEAAPTAGLAQTSSVSAGRDWSGSRLVAPKARR